MLDTGNNVLHIADALLVLLTVLLVVQPQTILT